MTEMAETHVELNQFPVPRVGPRHSTHYAHVPVMMLSAFDKSNGLYSYLYGAADVTI